MIRKLFSFFIGLAFFSFSFFTIASTIPESSTTPGLLCTLNDPHYSKLDYPEQIARCNRSVSEADKYKIAALYGNIPRNEWSNYEFDHLIPLCAGGSNDSENLWPQPIGEAHVKDRLEDQVCRQMRAGTLTQAEAISQLHDWFNTLARAQFANTYLTKVRCSSLNKELIVHFSIMGHKQIAAISLEDKFKKLSYSKVYLGESSNSNNVEVRKLILYKMKSPLKETIELFIPESFIDEEAKFYSTIKIINGNRIQKYEKLICE